jgi:hypothetical protein
MSKLLASLKKGLVRVSPLLITGAGAIVASSSFRHYVDKHPAIATAVPVVVWLLHAVGHAKTTSS